MKIVTTSETVSEANDRLRTNDAKNKKSFVFWDNSWSEKGVQGFSPHATVIAQAQWKYLQEDLSGDSCWVLEVGCGSGHMSALLAQSGYETILLDYSPAAITCARTSWGHMGGRQRKHYLMGNALTLPFADDSLDAVISCGVLEHFEDLSIPINEMARVLKKGGLFYADIWPRKFSLIGALDFLFPKPEGWYEARLDPEQITGILAAVGLNVKRLFAAGVLPPRNIPGTGRFKIIGRIERLCVKRFRRFWWYFDQTPIAKLIGGYYYISAVKN